MAKEPKSKTADAPFLNRELSWIDFNFRVLQQAEDAALPPLERLKFAAITASNADEFFMVRVGGLKQLRQQGDERPDPSGRTPAEQLEEIAARMRELVERQHACLLKEIEPALRKGGIRRLRMDELSAAQRRHVDALFADSIFPVITPVAVRPDEEFPLLAGLGLALCVRLEGAPEDPAPRHAVGRQHVDGVVEDVERLVLLAVVHQVVHELGHLHVTELGIGERGVLDCFLAHCSVQC